MIRNEFGITPKTPAAGFRPTQKAQGEKDVLPQDGLGPSIEQSEPLMKANRTHSNSRTQKRRERNYQRSNDYVQRQVAKHGAFQGAVALSNLRRPDGSWDLGELATKALQQAGLATSYPNDVQEQVADIVAQVRPSPDVYNHPEAAKAPWVKNLTDIPFISVDNGTLWTKMDPEKLKADPEANVSSRDIDQLQYVEQLPNGDIKVMVAVSDITAFVEKDSPLDRFVEKNTASVYTPDKVFNMIPPELAEDIASLNPREERLASVVEYTVTPEGKLKNEEVYQGIVKSRTKLDYASVGGFLQDEVGPSPAMLAQGPELIENLRVQAEASRRLEQAQDMKGAIEFDTTETRIITEDGKAIGIEESQKNVATEIVENFMVTTNGVMSRFLRSKGFATLERVVEPPEKWDRIVDLAKDMGYNLPKSPDAKALSDFMQAEKEKHPDKAGDLSISVIKLIGRGEYRGIGPNEKLPGHFPLGVENYTQTTASIRRGGDRVPARMLRAALSGESSPYTPSELSSMADNINTKSQDIKKAERTANKMVTATMLEDKVGQSFDAIVTGVKDGRAWCRISNPPVEGSLKASGRVRVGDKMTVELTSVNVEKGHIDFKQQ